MICVLEIAMLVWGIIVMVTGKLKVSKTKEVRGMAARGLAVFLILPLPLAFMVGVIYGLLQAKNGGNVNNLALSGIEVVLVLGCAAVAAIGGMVLGKEPQPPATGFPVQPPPQPPQYPQGPA